jgi:hypothetical protein
MRLLQNGDLKLLLKGNFKRLIVCQEFNEICSKQSKHDHKIYDLPLTKLKTDCRNGLIYILFSFEQWLRLFEGRIWRRTKPKNGVDLGKRLIQAKNGDGLNAEANQATNQLVFWFIQPSPKTCNLPNASDEINITRLAEYLASPAPLPMGSCTFVAIDGNCWWHVYCGNVRPTHRRSTTTKSNSSLCTPTWHCTRSNTSFFFFFFNHNLDVLYILR